MEAFRELALADYENMPEKWKSGLQKQFKDIDENGGDFAVILGRYSTHTRRFPDGWPEKCELFRKKRMDLEEFITAIYICRNAEEVLECSGCCLLITGKPYFICLHCFNVPLKFRGFNLCCECYRSKNFKDHQHRDFRSNQSVLQTKKAAASQDELEKRNKSINRAMMKFSAEFVDFARSIATDNEWENSFGALLNIDNAKKPVSPSSNKLRREKSDKEDENSTVSRNAHVDLFGMEPTL